MITCLVFDLIGYFLLLVKLKAYVLIMASALIATSRIWHQTSVAVKAGEDLTLLQDFQSCSRTAVAF